MRILPTIHFHHSRLVPAIWIQVKNFHREIYSLFDLRLVGIFLTFSISHNSTKFGWLLVVHGMCRIICINQEKVKVCEEGGASWRPVFRLFRVFPWTSFNIGIISTEIFICGVLEIFELFILVNSFGNYRFTYQNTVVPSHFASG